MKADFFTDFADFLEERLGKVLFELRESNKEYRKLSDEYSALLRSRYQTIEEYGQTMVKISEISKTLADIEKRYLFLAGMREHTRMNDAVLSEVFVKLFTTAE